MGKKDNSPSRRLEVCQPLLMRSTFLLALAVAALSIGQSQAQSSEPVSSPGDTLENNLVSGGCPTQDGIIAVLVAMAQTGRGRDTMVRNDCLPFPPKMKIHVEEVLANNILKITAPDFPGSPPMFVSGSGYHKASLPPSATYNQAPPWFSETKVNAGIASLSSYQDVAPTANCTAPKSNVDRMICRNPRLRLAELLNTRADVYATENATKRELNHRRFKGKLPMSCATDQCIFDSFRTSTNDFLGGMSPYAGR